MAPATTSSTRTTARRIPHSRASYLPCTKTAWARRELPVCPTLEPSALHSAATITKACVFECSNLSFESSHTLGICSGVNSPFISVQLHNILKIAGYQHCFGVFLRIFCLFLNQLEEAIWTHIYTTFGQFLTHDLGETGVSVVAAGCSCSSTDANCLPIKMPTGDTVMKSECITFTRSSATLPLDCASSQREQLNLVTAYIDGSQVYGSSASSSNHLRTFNGGELITSTGLLAGRDYLPTTAQVCSAAGSEKCFESGDHRTTENLGLSGLHTLFLREHNRLARELAKVNSAWNDETLFQETRRIVVAILQHITYNQYVPGTIGLQNLDAYQIRPNTGVNSVATYFTGYNSSVSGKKGIWAGPIDPLLDSN